MLNFKLRKGEIATLLTLGLILVGTLITLGTSFFVSNKKTNLASNSKAATGIFHRCSLDNPIYKKGGYYICNGQFYYYSNCTKDVSEGVGTYCKNMNLSTSSPTIPATPTGCINNIPSLYECKDAFNDKPVTYSSATKKCCLAGNTNPTSTISTPPTSSPEGCGSGGAYPCDPAQGYNTKSCPKANLEFACCVKDNKLCNGEPRYRWYGCTGQPCGNTKINNSYGQLFGCPAGINASNTSPESGICESQLPPTKAPAPTSPPSGYEGGSCEGLYKEDGMWKGTCINNNLTCDYKTGKCIKYTPPTVIPAAGGTNCTDADYTILANDYCGADSYCGPQQRKYKKSANNTCIPTSQTNSEFKCKNDNFCNSNPLDNVPVPTLNTSAVQCTNQECPSPNKGILYSYKCASIPQTINGATQCPSYNFYAGEKCESLLNNVNLNNIKDKYCNASYTSSEAKRNVLVSYIINQIGTLDIDPSNPVATFTISNNYGLRLYSQSITIGEDSFPINKNTTLKTGSNILKWTFQYKPSNSTIPKTLNGSANVIDGTANINFDIK